MIVKFKLNHKKKIDYYHSLISPMSCKFAELPNDIKNVVVDHLTDNKRNHAILMFELNRVSSNMFILRNRGMKVIMDTSTPAWRELMGYDRLDKVDTFPFKYSWLRAPPRLIKNRWLFFDSDEEDDDLYDPYEYTYW